MSPAKSLKNNQSGGSKEHLIVTLPSLQTPTPPHKVGIASISFLWWVHHNGAMGCQKQLPPLVFLSRPLNLN